MTRGVAINLLEVSFRVGMKHEAAENEKLAGENNSLSGGAVKRAINPYIDYKVELSMKAPMSVSKLEDLG